MGPAFIPWLGIFIFKAVDLVDLKCDCASISTVSEDQYHTPSKEYYGKEVYFTVQNPTSKCCKPLDF